MSRAINLNVPEADVVAQCSEACVEISVVEPLPSGGTHLVCTTSDGANEMRLRFQDHIIEGVVKRFPFYRTRGPW